MVVNAELRYHDGVADGRIEAIDDSENIRLKKFPLISVHDYCYRAGRVDGWNSVVGERI